MRQYFKARAKKGYHYLNYDTDKRLYALGEIQGADYALVRARDLREIMHDLDLDGYKNGISIEDDPDDIPFR